MSERARAIAALLSVVLMFACHQRPGADKVLAAVKADDDIELAKLLDDGATANAHDESQFAPTYALSISSSRGDLRAVELLLAHRAEVDPWAESPLGFAARAGHVEIVRELVAAHARLEGGPKDSETPLALAANFGKLEAIDALLIAGANPDGGSGYGPLGLATEAECVPCVKRLLSGGAHVNHSDTLGMTALHFAAIKENAELAKLLLDAKADPLVANRAGWTPAFTAQYHANPDVLAVFRAAGVSDFDMKPPPPLPPSGMGTVTVPVVTVQGL